MTDGQHPWMGMLRPCGVRVFQPIHNSPTEAPERSARLGTSVRHKPRHTGAFHPPGVLCNNCCQGEITSGLESALPGALPAQTRLRHIGQSGYWLHRDMNASISSTLT